MVLQSLINEIEMTTKNMLSSEPESVKKLVRGEISSDAGVGKQYFSTMVFALTYTLTLGEHVIYHILDLLDNSDMTLDSYKDLVRAFLAHGFKASSFLGYVMDPDIERFSATILENLDAIDKAELRAVLAAYFTYINAIHWWIHVRFPWGLGVAFRKVNA